MADNEMKSEINAVKTNSYILNNWTNLVIIEYVSRYIDDDLSI